jgi:LmbE family N-acetylglucosaminyl deacetylase/chitodextrinase
MSRLALRASVFLLAAGLPLLGMLIVRAPAHAAGSGNVLVVVAHPDDEALGMAGVIKGSRDAGRRVYVAIATNGDQGGSGSTGTAYCGASGGSQRYAAELGLQRDGETIGAMGELGLSWSASLNGTDVYFLGYPDGHLSAVAGSSGGITSDATGLHHTFARAGNGSSSDSCNGDFGYLYSGSHSALNQSSLARDFDRLIAQTNPTDIYTHATFDSHGDHSEVGDQIAAAAQRSGKTITLHGTLIHPEGSGACDTTVDWNWPNPAINPGSNPAARSTPTQTFQAPPTPVCSSNPTGTSWGSAGAPDERITVPASMQDTNLANNLKWKALSHYDSQLNCDNWDAVWCGYMHAFVKKDEIFWVQGFNGGGPPPDLTPPAKPAKPTVTALDKAVRVTLSPLNGEDDLDSYSLQRKKSTDSSWSTVKSDITGWPYTDSGLANGTTYNYRVIAYDTHGNASTPSDAATATPADATPPAKPATPTASAGDGSVTVNLSPLNTDADLASYTLQRKRTSDTAWTSVKTGITTWPYTDTGLANGTSYDYRVLAVDNAGNASAASGSVSATPVAPAPAPVAPPPVTAPITTPIVVPGPLTDLIAPRISIRRPARRTLAQLRADGLTLKVRCSEACTLSGALDLLVTFTAKNGKRKVNAHVLGRSKPVSLGAAGAVTLRIKLSPAGSRLLASTVGKLKYRVVAHDRAGNEASSARTVKFRR